MHAGLTGLRAFCAVVLLTVGSGTAIAGGFRMNEHSARSAAMGGTIAASTDDPTAMSVNPAVLAFLQGTNLSLGASVVVPNYRFTGVTPLDGSTKIQPQSNFPPDIALTFSSGSSIAFGVAADIPYTIQTAWAPEWVGRRIAVSTDLRTVFITPALAFQPTPSLSIGFGMNIVASSVLLSHRIGFDSLGQPEGTATYQGDTRFDYGFEVGILYHPGNMLSVGLSYGSTVKVDIGDGSASFTGIPSQLAASFPSSEARTSLSTPDCFQGGFALHFGTLVTLMGDVEYTLWSRYESLSITFKDAALKSITLPEHWKDSWTGRFGLELAFPGITVRGGLIVDQSPIPDETLRPTVPDANKIGYTLGLGYTVAETLQLDFAVVQYQLADRTVTDSQILYLPGQYFNGTYSGTTTIIGLTVSYSWN